MTRYFSNRLVIRNEDPSNFVQLTIHFPISNCFKFVEEVHIHRCLMSKIRWQDNLMRVLVESQKVNSKLSDVEFIFQDKDSEGFSRTKFANIEPIPVVKDYHSFRFYILNKSIKDLNCDFIRNESGFEWTLMEDERLYHLTMDLVSTFFKSLELLDGPEFPEFIKEISFADMATLIGLSDILKCERLVQEYSNRVAFAMMGQSSEEIYEMFNFV